MKPVQIELADPCSDAQALQRTPPGTVGHPPKPRLTVRVGVTGHRTNALPSEGGNQQLRNVVKQVLEEIIRITLDIFSRREESGIETYSCQEPSIHLISPLAEGADRLVAEEALELGIELHCPLPFSHDE